MTGRITPGNINRAGKRRPGKQRRVIELVQLFENADDQTFKDRVESYLNVDQFLRHLAVHTITSNLDSILCRRPQLFPLPQSDRRQVLFQSRGI